MLQLSADREKKYSKENMQCIADAVKSLPHTGEIAVTRCGIHVLYIRINKDWVSARSPYFARLFAEQSETVTVEYEVNTVNAVMDYINGKPLPVFKKGDLRSMLNIYDAANQFEIPQLAKYIGELLSVAADSGLITTEICRLLKDPASRRDNLRDILFITARETVIEKLVSISARIYCNKCDFHTTIDTCKTPRCGMIENVLTSAIIRMCAPCYKDHITQVAHYVITIGNGTARMGPPENTCTTPCTGVTKVAVMNRDMITLLQDDSQGDLWSSISNLELTVVCRG